jgi:ATP adenylyltransferase
LKKKEPAKDWAERIVRAVWPQEREFMERPERYQYVRKILPPTDCVFCVAEQAPIGPESLVLAKDERCYVVMNKYPYNSGHLLILPRRHVGNIWELDDATLEEMARWQKRSVMILKDVLECQGFNLGLNQGAVAGAGIPGHFHWHVIPRWGGDTNFFPLIGETKVLPETLESTYSRLQGPFQKG